MATTATGSGGGPAEVLWPAGTGPRRRAGGGTPATGSGLKVWKTIGKWKRAGAAGGGPAEVLQPLAQG